MTSELTMHLIHPSRLPTNWGTKLLPDVANINKESSNLRDLDWINYTDISSVATRVAQPPTMLGSGEAPSRARRILRKGDSVISTVRPTRRSFFFFDGEWENAIASTGFAVISPKSLEDARFLYTILTSDFAVAIYESLCEGGVYPAFNPKTLEALSVPWPPTPVRRQIGAITNVFEEQIANNSQHSRTLELLAQSFFKSWFIDFDPVKAKMAGEVPVGMDAETAALFPDSMEESELGEIPTGWVAQPLDSIADYLNGLALQKFPVVDDSDVLPVIKIAQLRAGHTRGADFASGSLDPRYVIEDGDILFSWSGSLEVEYWTGGRGALNQHLFKVSGNTVPDWFAYFATRSYLGEFRAIASSKATTMGHIQRRHLTEALLAVPPNDVLERASRFIGPLVSLRTDLLKQNTTLGKLRDSLLPRLISGELKIPDEMLAE